MGCQCKNKSTTLVSGFGEQSNTLPQTLEEKNLFLERLEICRTCEKSEKRKRKDGSLGLTSFSKCEMSKKFVEDLAQSVTENCPLNQWKR